MGEQHLMMYGRWAKRRFYQIATKAIEMGLLTPAERDTIRRRATRNRGNWVRRLRNLQDYVEYKRARENEEHDL